MYLPVVKQAPLTDTSHSKAAHMFTTAGFHILEFQRFLGKFWEEEEKVSPLVKQLTGEGSVIPQNTRPSSQGPTS